MTSKELKTIIDLIDKEISKLNLENNNLLEIVSPLLSLRNEVVRKFYLNSDFNLSLNNKKLLNKINWTEVLE